MDRLRALGRTNGEDLVLLAENGCEAVAGRAGRPAWIASSPPVTDPSLQTLLAEERSWLQGMKDSVAAAYVSTLALVYSKQGVRGGGERVSSEALSEIASTIVNTRIPDVAGDALRIYDPAAGTGSLGMRIARDHLSVVPRFFGQELATEPAAMARANGFMSGVESVISVGDSLRMDAFPEEQFELIVADPPYQLTWDPTLERTGDARFPAGVPQAADATLLFAQIVATKLRPPEDGGGRGILYCSPTALVGRHGSQIREWLLSEDLLEAIIALPEGLSFDTSISLRALVLNNRKVGGWKEHTQVIDLRGFTTDSGRRSDPGLGGLSADGHEELRRALERPKPTAHARTVGPDAFRFDEVRVVHPALRTPRRGSRAEGMTVTRWLSKSTSVESWMKDRYSAGSVPTISVDAAKTEVRFDITSAFLNSEEREVRAELTRLSWPSTRLASLVTSLSIVPSIKSMERDRQAALVPSGPNLLALPFEVHGDATVVRSVDELPDNRSAVLKMTTAPVQPAFVADWLNAPGGRAARRAALGMSMRGGPASLRSPSSAQVATFVDELVVPAPSDAVQQDLIAAGSSLRAAFAAVSSAENELWAEPSGARLLRRRIKSVGDEQDLYDWTQRLPYPLAGALWVYETEKRDPVPALGHLLRFWEATAEFLGVVLISALESDTELRDQEFAALRSVLRNANLSLDTATFGTWAAVMQRLSATFRRVLAGDDDTRSKVVRSFGGLNISALERLLDPRVGTLLGNANNYRNEWHGHSGPATRGQASERLDILLEMTEELRSLHAPVWEHFRLVRAGRMTLRQGRYSVQVELLSAPMAPFRQREIELAEGLEEGRLYLTAVDEDQVLALNDLIVLRSSPASANYTCYFYSRREGDAVKLVSYQFAEESAVIDTLPGVDRLLSDFAGGARSHASD